MRPKFISHTKDNNCNTMSAKWIAIVIGSLLGAALLGISVHMLGFPALKSTDDVRVTPIAKDSAQLITSSDLGKSIPAETTAEMVPEATTPEAVQIVSSKTTPLEAESITSQSTQP